MTEKKTIKNPTFLPTYRPFKFNPYIMNVSAISYTYIEMSTGTKYQFGKKNQGVLRNQSKYEWTNSK